MRTGSRSVWVVIVAAGCALAAGCADPKYPPAASTRGAQEIDVAPPPTCATSLEPASIDTVAVGLDIPWDVTFPAPGIALVTERPGRIRTIANGVLAEEPWATLRVFDDSETGLMGIDHRPVDGDPDQMAIYVSATVEAEIGTGVGWLFRGLGRRVQRMFAADRGQTRYLQVIRLVWAPDRAEPVSQPEVWIDGLPSGPIHAGGTLRFGPDGDLYVSKGDAGSSEWAQATNSLRGKILRYTPEGGIPDDNPTPGSPIWATGTRDGQGLAWDPELHELFAIDHGPSATAAGDFRQDHDELNPVPAGANLGWPIVIGYTRGGPFVSPVRSWTPAIAPAGLAFYDHEDSPWYGSAFITALRGASLRRLELEKDEGGWRVTCEDTLLGFTHGRLRLVRVAPDGSLWVGTSNRDQNGTPQENSDLILRLRPPEWPTS